MLSWIGGGASEWTAELAARLGLDIPTNRGSVHAGEYCDMVELIGARRIPQLS